MSGGLTLRKGVIRYASLFSGLGGFELALNNFNTECVFASEIDKFARRAYETYFGHEPHGDITLVGDDEVPEHELLVGGFPCQAFSIAGHRAGFEDARGTLFFEIARIAKAKKPKAVLLENVKGLLSHDKGRTITIMLEILSGLGYAVDFSVLNSKHWLPQNRERVFIIGLLDTEEEDYVIPHTRTGLYKLKKRLNENTSIRSFNFSWPDQEGVPYRLLDVLEDEVDEKYFLSDEMTKEFLEEISEKYQLNGTPIESLSVLGLVKMRGNESVRRVYDANGLSPTLTTMEGGHREPKIVVERQRVAKSLEFVGGIGGPPQWSRDKEGLSRSYRQGHRVYAATGIASTLTAKGLGSLGGHTGLYLMPNLTVRKLTPLECFRLQGIPDEYYHSLRDNGFSDRQLYRLSGNAVTVPVVSSLLEHLLPQLSDSIADENIGHSEQDYGNCVHRQPS